MKAAIADAPVALLGEGPVLFPDSSLYWVDILRGDVWRRVGQGPSERVAGYPHEVSKVLPWREGYLVCGRESVEFVDGAGRTVGHTPLHSRESNLRCSDAMVAPDGTVFVGVIDRDLRPGRSSLVRLGGGEAVAEVVSGVDLSNGVSLHPDGVSLLWIDSPTQSIWRWEWSGSSENRHRFADISPELGVPDGLCVDGSGRCYVALWGGAGVLVIDPSGDPETRIDVGVPHVTSCAFDAQDDLLITTASVALGESERDDYPGAGCLWRVAQPEIGRRGLDSLVATITPARDGESRAGGALLPPVP